MRLWLIRESEQARLYSTLPPGRHPVTDPHDPDCDVIWVPKSIIEHTTKRGAEHDVKLPDWFIEKVGL